MTYFKRRVIDAIHRKDVSMAIVFDVTGPKLIITLRYKIAPILG